MTVQLPAEEGVTEEHMEAVAEREGYTIDARLESGKTRRLGDGAPRLVLFTGLDAERMEL